MSKDQKDRQFVVLEEKFDGLAKRLKETHELAERQSILKQISQLIAEIEVLIQVLQKDLQRELDEARKRLSASS